MFGIMLALTAAIIYLVNRSESGSRTNPWVGIPDDDQPKLTPTDVEKFLKGQKAVILVIFNDDTEAAEWAATNPKQPRTVEATLIEQHGKGGLLQVSRVLNGADVKIGDLVLVSDL